MSGTGEQLAAYLKRAGLLRDPFSSTINQSYYFLTSGLEQRLDLIHHVIEYGKQVVAVEGPEGIGKTALLEQLEKKARSNWRICRLIGDPAHTAPQILAYLARSFGLDLSSVPAAHGHDALKKHLAKAHGYGRLVVTLVDDVESFPMDTIQLLLRLGHASADEGGLRVVFFHRPPGKGVVPMPWQSDGGGSELVHVLDVPAFSRAELPLYLRERFLRAGLRGGSPFDDAGLDQVFAQSQGVPGKISVLIRQQLAHESAATQATPVGLWWINKWLLGVLVVVLGGLAVLLGVTRQDEDQFMENSTVQLETPVLVVPGDRLSFLGRDLSAPRRDPPAGTQAGTQVGIEPRAIAPEGVDNLPEDLSAPDSSFAVQVPAARSQYGGTPPAAATVVPSPVVVPPVAAASKIPRSAVSVPIPIPTLAPTPVIEDPVVTASKITQSVAPDPTPIPTSALTKPPRAEARPQTKLDPPRPPDLKLDPPPDPKPESKPDPRPDPRPDRQLAKMGALGFEVVEQTPSMASPKPGLASPALAKPASPKQALAPPPTERVERRLPGVSRRAQRVSGDPALSRDPRPVSSPPATLRRDEAWILAQASTSFMLQIFGARDPGAVARFVAKHDLGEHISQFTTKHNEEEWIVVLYGLYESRGTAQAAIDGLPSYLRDLNPWARQVGDVQRQIR